MTIQSGNTGELNLMPNPPAVTIFALCNAHNGFHLGHIRS
jgi:hypothetical protein